MTLPPSIVSQTDLAALIYELKAYRNWFSHTTIKHSVNAKAAQATIPTLSAAALEMVRDKSNGTLLKQQHIEQLIDELEVYGAVSPSVTITLAAPAPQSLKMSMAHWCRENMSPNTLVNFSFNATLLGGMVVQCGSHIFDWSWRRAILNNRGKFAEVLRRV